MPEYSPSAGGRRTWRQKALATPTGGGKMVPRIVSSLLGIGLTGLLVWLIWWWFFFPKTYFACLPIVNYGVLTVSPIPFASEDAAAFGELGPPERTVNLSDFEISKNIGTLAQGLHKLAMRPKDVLILSVDAHGVSEDGIAYLLPSDYFPNPNSPNSGRCKVSDFLNQIHETQAGLKVLILDANHLAYDPRLGMVGNEFSHLLEEEVKKLNDPALWVLSSAGPMQLSQISTAAKRSVFSEAVTEGLRGAADSNRNGMVELDEFFRYVGQEVSKIAGQITMEEQMPRMLHGGVGLADPPEKITLTTYSAKKPQTESQENPPPDKQLAEDRAKLKKILGEAWAQRDRIQDRSQGDGWTPVDYAPHLWREFQAFLLGCEQRYRGGTAFPARKLAGELQKEIDAWNEAEKNPLAPSSPQKELILGRLASARRDFLQSDAKKRLDQNEERTVALKKALQLKNDLAFWTPYYVCYHAASADLSVQQNSLFQPLSRLLDKLPALYEALEARQTANNSRGAVTDLHELMNDSADFDAFRNPSSNENLRSEMQNLLESAKTSPKPRTAISRVEALLTTPLLSTSQRTQLLDLREKIEPTPTTLETSASGLKLPGGIKTAVPNWRWQRLFEQANLERKLVLSADPQQKISLAKEMPQVDSPEAENSMWLACRQMGKQLGDFYASLPGRINQGLDMADQSALQRIGRLLRLVDARDAKLIESKATACAVPLLPETEKPANRLTISVEKLQQLPRKGWLPFELTLQNSANISGTAKVALQFEGDLMEIVNLENNQPIRPSKQFTVSFNQESAKVLKLRARALRQSDFKTNVEVETILGDQQPRTTMTFRLAPPEVIDLTVLAFGHLIKQSTPSADRLHLWPFPNRTTNYALALVNHSGRARKVLVEIYALPAPPRGERKFEGSPLDTSGKAKPGLISLAGAEPIEVSLPADDSPATITFPAPKTPASEKEKTKEAEKSNADKPSDKPGDQKPEEKAKPSIDITHGMVCVIRDAETKEPRWIKWLDCSPRKPRDYLKPDVRYDAAHGRISINITADESQALPSLSPENPLHIVWANASESTATGAVIDRATLTTPGQTAVLSADVESAANKKVKVKLTVDDYPRAFVYSVPCDSNDAKPIDPQTDRVEIHITTPSAGQSFRVPLEKPIPLELQADAPEDAFLNEEDSLQVMIVAENNERELSPEEHRWFYGDRQSQIFLNELAPSGEMTIGTKVGDFKIPLGTGGLLNTRVRIMSQIGINNPNLPDPRILRQDAVPILLQGDPPVLKSIAIVPDKPIPLGQPVDGNIAVEKAYSPIKEIQIGIDRDFSGILEESDKPVKMNQSDDDGKWRFTLPTEGLQSRRYTIITKAMDILGFTSKPITKTIRIDPPPSIEEKKAATTSTVVGHVTDQDGHPLAKIRVTLQGTNFSEMSDSDGNITFKKVPHGKYKLEARGIVIGSERSSEQEIVLPGASEPFKVDVRMVW